ncbi:MAG: hypothetical protein ACK5MP_00185 [Nostocoides sp.]
MSEQQSVDPGSKSSIGDTLGKWLAIAIVALVIALLVAAVVPRWWAQQVGGLIDGRITYGSAVGVAAGFIFTLAPLLFFIGAWKVRSKGGLAALLVILGGIFAMPNLMTLWIVVGTGSASHAGERILDVDGPGFRGGSLIGAVIGALVFLYVLYLQISRDRVKRRERKEQERQAKARAELAAEAEARTEDPGSDA